MLRGEKDAETARVHDPGFYGERDIRLRTGEAATALDTTGRTVTLAGGDVLPWDCLLITSLDVSYAVCRSRWSPYH